VSLFDKLTDYEIIDILVALDNIWDVVYATTICKRFQKLIYENKNMFFMKICGVDITKRLEYEDHNALCCDLPDELNYSDYDYDIVAIYKLMSMMNIETKDPLYYDEKYHELLYSDDFRPDVLVLDPGYLDRFEYHEDRKLRKICGKYINGYVSCRKYNKKIVIPTKEDVMKHSSVKIFNTKKYKDMLSDPFEEVSKKQTHNFRKYKCETPYTFCKSTRMNDKLPRSNARDIIKVIVENCEHHCACWSESGTSTIKIKVVDGITIAYVDFDTESG
jgi:hypothetical protein